MALLCHCRLVSDRRIIAELSEGATTVAEVQARCGVATRCGGCLPAVELLVAAAATQPVGAVA
jgi:bacterioferritin-associated ferredoxin